MKHAKTSMRHSQAGFGTLTLLGIIVGFLLVTGIGRQLWHSTLSLGDSCHTLAEETGIMQIADTCDAIGESVARLRLELEHMVGMSRFGDMMDLEGFAGMVARSFSQQAIGFSSPSLAGFINFDGLGSGSLDPFSQALTQGSIGSNYLSMGKADMGLPYLQSSANMGDMGVLSQLSLGSAYASGTGGVGRDMGMSRYYNSMALNSIQSLQSSGSPQSKQLLGALPSSPNNMVRSLKSALGK
ncbi:MAG: hypothetical protein MRY32_04370 [Rickettsiales bacterium]|nr:hypothetical protein [Rickettsiales bacterium]